MFEMNLNKDRLRRLASQEDGHCISVGGLVTRLKARSETVQIPEHTRKLALARLVEFSRRKRRLTVEQLADQADVDVDELLAIEAGGLESPEPRTIYQLSQSLGISNERLMVLSGLAVARDAAWQESAVRFAARSEPMNDLTPQEEAALQDFVIELAKITDEE